MQLGQNFDESNKENYYLNSIYGAPTSTKRRIHQSLNLAKRLQIKQKENEELIKQIKEKADELERINQEYKVARDLLDKTNQPLFIVLYLYIFAIFLFITYEITLISNLVYFS